MINNFIPPLPNFLNHNSPEEDRNAEPIVLIMKDTTIHSLKDLRENYSPDELLKYHLDNKLVRWLNQHYYETEASAISLIRLEDNGCLENICEVLKLPFKKNLSCEETASLEAKKELLKKYTDDALILENASLVAFNQEDLATLLNKKEKKIYLCSDEFNIPITISGIHYISIGNSIINNPFTAEQYTKAGITLTGFTLPQEINPSTESYARQAALNNGYDDFSENYSPLASAFHILLKQQKLVRSYHIPYKSSLTAKFFNSKYDCDKAAKEEILSAYNYAEKKVVPGSSESLDREFAKQYSEALELTITPYMDLLKKVARMTDSYSTYQKIEDMVTGCNKTLRKIFCSELEDSSDYYRMYELNYFLDQIEITEHDYRISEDDIFRFLEKLISDHIQYTVNDIYSPISEIEQDLNKHCSTFFTYAHTEYKEYLAKIEQLIDTMGTKLIPMDDNESLTDYLSRCCIKLAS